MVTVRTILKNTSEEKAREEFLRRIAECLRRPEGETAPRREGGERE